MDVATIQMDPAQAREKLRHYRSGVHRKADREWERAAVAYEQLAQGTPLIVLSEAISQAPRDANGRPRLAIARADRKQVRMHWPSRESITYLSTADLSVWGGLQRRAAKWPDLVLNTPCIPGLVPHIPTDNASGFALVPMVPPEVLGTRQLREHFILWEVEAWAERKIGAVPDRDPYLLKRVADDLYAVVGEWDLTDVERAIMRDRRTP